MKGFKQCPQGHFYKETLATCPYCDSPENTDAGGATEDPTIENQTVPVTQSNTETDIPTNKETDAASDKTQVFGEEKTKEFSTTDMRSNNDFTDDDVDLSKTVIGGTEIESGSPSSSSTQRRKLKGWVVTFDLESYGRDFPIREGTNKIGRSSDNEISVPDQKVTSHHCTILYRHAEKAFFINDNMSNNGTFLNGNSLPPHQASELKDGDQIKIGDVNFLFRQAF